MKKQHGGKRPEDIWSSLILSLPPEEIARMTPGEGREEEKRAVGVTDEVDNQEDEEDDDEVVVVVAKKLEDTDKDQREKMDKTQSVKDLKKAYDSFAR